MSLDDDQAQAASITAYEAALNLFTDRVAERRLFASYLNDDPPRKRILFFHGDGGNGKSWLLRILRERYCKRFPLELWAWIKRVPDKEFPRDFEQVPDFQPVSHAYLDFADINHDNPPRDAFHGPRLLRKQLGRQGLSFPLYDFALLLYWIKGRGESRASAKTLFPAEEAEFVDKLLNCVYESKTVERVSAVLKLFDAHFGERFGLYLKKRKLDEAEWRRLESLDANAQLCFELARLFALDLNAALAEGRAVSRSGFATPTGTFEGRAKAQNVSDGVANPVALRYLTV